MMIYLWMESPIGMFVCFGTMALVLVLATLYGCCIVSGRCSDAEDES